jgi:hypothetical protein
MKRWVNQYQSVALNNDLDSRFARKATEMLRGGGMTPCANRRHQIVYSITSPARNKIDVGT